MSKHILTSFSHTTPVRGRPLFRTSLALVLLTATSGMFAPAAAQASSNKHLLASSHATLPPSGAAGLCQTYRWACTRDAGVRKVSAQAGDVMVRVNRQVNRTIRYVPDERQFKTADHWSLPTARGGDCEDFALLKKQKLLEMGFPPQALLIATVLDKNRSGHAVLVVRTTDGDMVLDNATDRILPWAETGYFFLRMQDPKAPSRWISIVSS